MSLCIGVCVRARVIVCVSVFRVVCKCLSTVHKVRVEAVVSVMGQT